MKLTENWQVKHVNYHSKKKAKLWLTVRIEDVNSYNPAIESNNHYIAMVEFNGKNEPVILWDNYNSKGLPKKGNLNSSQQEMVINAAIEKSKQYLK